MLIITVASMRIVICLFLIGVSAPETAGADLQPLLSTLHAVGPKGIGSREAAGAWEKLAQADAAQLHVVLAGLDQANPLAANWIRTAVDAIAERQLQRGAKLPAAELEGFVEDTRHAPRARRLAYEWLIRVDPTAHDRVFGNLGSKMLNDPSIEMRREAVALVIDEAARLQKQDRTAEAATTYRRALTSARDPDQVRLLADRLRKMGQAVDLVRHFGFLVRWKLIGPFDNRDGKGFDAVYGPEREVNLTATYPGKHGTVRWIDHASTDPLGLIDFHKAIVEEKGVVGYAVAEFHAKARQEVEFRATTFNAMKLWLNGKLLMRQPVYHSGSQLDQYVTRAVLQPGKNVILVKVCQNEQTQEWTRHWDFQLRVCDALGGGILFTASN